MLSNVTQFEKHFDCFSYTFGSNAVKTCDAMQTNESFEAKTSKKLICFELELR